MHGCVGVGFGSGSAAGESNLGVRFISFPASKCMVTDHPFVLSLEGDFCYNYIVLLELYSQAF